ncbi:unnamed protein product, partial [Polarella glacialis]
VAERRDGRRARVEAEQQDMLRILRPLGLQTAPADSGMTPGQVLMAEMLATLERMSAPAREAAEEAGVWWRDPGHASDVVDGSKYSVDAWGRRRGASKRGCCAWYRWSLSSVPVRMRAQLSTNCLSGAEHHSEMFVCWWCGGPALAHEDLGPASDKEEIGFFPGFGPGRTPWRKPLMGLDAMLQEDLTPTSGDSPKFQRISLWEATSLQPATS